MTAHFADTSYYIALINPDDDAHAAAVKYTENFSGSIVTTGWILNELANFLVRPPNRRLFLELLSELRSDPRVTIVAMQQQLFDEGVALYGRRLDKEWSLTDCVSFLVMQRSGIADALTTDHHFEQAGFRSVLA